MVGEVIRGARVFVFRHWNLFSPHVQIKDVCYISINCPSVYVWYMRDIWVICASALESTHTQQDYNLGLNETGSIFEVVETLFQM